MNKTILQQLFDGEIFPSEDISPIKTNPEARKLNNTISDEMEYFFNTLSEIEKKRFQNLYELHNEYSSMYGYECFTYGFKLGAKILIDIFYNDSIS